MFKIAGETPTKPNPKSNVDGAEPINSATNPNKKQTFDDKEKSQMFNRYRNRFFDPENDDSVSKKKGPAEYTIEVEQFGDFWTYSYYNYFAG